MIDSISSLSDYQEKLSAEREKYRKSISVCGGPGCLALNCGDIFSAFESCLEKEGLRETVELKMTGCHGYCEMAPLVVIHPLRIFYGKLRPEDVPTIVQRTVIGDEPVEELLYVDPATGERVDIEEEVPFYKKQMRNLLDLNERIDPNSIDDYLAIGGYRALAKVLTDMEPVEVIEEVDRAGLRGRGGGGFPAARKWRSCRNATARDGIKYVLCNADEGDPGAFMDRALLEGNPQLVIEGMLIGAYAIGANQGYIFVRHEYPLAARNAANAIEQARELGLIGDNILGTDFGFGLNISMGGGAFVCGESTALMASIEGRMGEPREKYIHTAEKGLYMRPTNLNNVETWANVPLIINEGAESYASIGTEGSKGTKIFSLVGKIRNTGLVEVPMGMTLREIIEDIGGGMADGKKFKAVQTGGPSGGCIPDSLLDTPVDFDRLYDVGSMMGSGGMIVMDEDTCMVDIARYFIDFLCEESCGKCVPCREGLRQMYNIITDIVEGRGSLEQLELLQELAEVVRDASLCGLGQTAPNPVLSTMRYFPEEYHEHIVEKRCRAGVCKALISFDIDPEKCTGCMKCIKACPAGAISGKREEPHVIDDDKCERCGICYEICDFDAVLRK